MVKYEVNVIDRQVKYEVNLIDRQTGNVFECIYGSNDHHKAYLAAKYWNKQNIADYDDGLCFSQYVDGKTYGCCACVYAVARTLCMD